MSTYSVSDYTYAGLCDHGKLHLTGESLAYLVGLVTSVDNDIIDTHTAKTTLRLLYDLEEQCRDALGLLDLQKSLPKNYFPQTPVMLTRAWSPIGAMLARGHEPLVLCREDARKSFATGIWAPGAVRDPKLIADCHSPEDLFWSVLAEAFRRGGERGMLISIVAGPGWAYELAIGSLPELSEDEISKAGRILWARTPSYSPAEVRQMIQDMTKKIVSRESPEEEG